MSEEEKEILISSYLKKARNISHDFSAGNLVNESYIQQFADGIKKLVNPKPLIEYKIESFNYFLEELLKIKNRINELKDSVVDE